MASASAYPRDLAVRALTRVLSDRVPLDEALEGAPPESRAWLLEVCAGTLRWRGRLDAAVDVVALKKKPSGWLRKALLLGAYQLIAQERTSPGAVVSETVAEVRKREGEAPAKFANACLRKVAEHSRHWRDLEFPAQAPAAEQAQWASLPEWFWSRLVADHGEAWAAAYARACLERPSLWLRARDADTDLEGKRGPVAAAWRATDGGKVSGREGYAQGKFIVQDISSQTLVEEISRRVSGERGGPGRALDLCAAPGGKAIALAWLGWQVTASDRDPARLERMRENLARTQAAVNAVSPEQLQGGGSRFDLVWVDAPCTGSGIIRRHPEVRWLRTERELASLQEVQAGLLQRAWDKVEDGGYLAYTVCSVFRDEGEQRIQQAQLSGREVARWSLAPHDPPCGDGFWGILIRKAP
jgi:16S rRNA (cytosine967-C5)-methyltransferase